MTNNYKHPELLEFMLNMLDNYELNTPYSEFSSIIKMLYKLGYDCRLDAYYRANFLYAVYLGVAKEELKRLNEL